MTQITGGRIVYGRTVQPAQYESKKAEVELTFSVEDGAYDEAALDGIIHTAIEKAHAMVGLAKGVKAKAEVTETKVEPKAEKPKGKTKADLEKEAVAKGGGDIALDVLDLTEKPAKAAKPNDELGDMLGPSATTFTDKDLIDAVNNKNKEINNPKAIKAVCLKYTAQAIKDIPADKRAAFVAELSTLTKA